MGHGSSLMAHGFRIMAQKGARSLDRDHEPGAMSLETCVMNNELEGGGQPGNGFASFVRDRSLAAR